MPLKLSLADLESLARAAGFESYPSMLHTLYVIERMGMKNIALACGVTELRIRKHLIRFKIPLRERGGYHPSHTGLILTEELVDEVIRYGIRATALRHKVSAPALYIRLRAIVCRKLQPERGLLLDQIEEYSAPEDKAP